MIKMLCKVNIDSQNLGYGFQVLQTILSLWIGYRDTNHNASSPRSTNKLGVHHICRVSINNLSIHVWSAIYKA